MIQVLNIKVPQSHGIVRLAEYVCCSWKFSWQERLTSTRYSNWHRVGVEMLGHCVFTHILWNASVWLCLLKEIINYSIMHLSLLFLNRTRPQSKTKISFKFYCKFLVVVWAHCGGGKKEASPLHSHQTFSGSILWQTKFSLFHNSSST